MKKILFWILAIAMLPVGWFLSFTCYMAHGLHLSSTIIGEVACIAGILSLGVCIVGAVLGIIKLCKGNAKKALGCALIGVIYCGIIFAGIALDEAVSGMLLERDIANRNEQMYGEGWDAPSAIEGIPELYQQVLNEYYAIVRDRWPADRLMDIGAVSMAGYYGDEPMDNIGFVLMDLNGDACDELVIGATGTGAGEGTAIFCIYTDTENPFYAINSVEGQTYYLHSGETEGTYLAEIAGADAAWVIEPVERANAFDMNYLEGAMDSAGRMALELIPLSQYK